MYETTTQQRHPAAWMKRAIIVGFLAAAMLTAGLGGAPPAHAATTFTVNSGADASDSTPGNGVCDTDPTAGIQCTLRGAMQSANAIPGADTINFNIPATRPVNIPLTSPLPTITEQVTIDGYTQNGASPNTLTVGDNAFLMIVLDGELNGLGPMLKIENSSNSVIKGLAINRINEDGSGISITGNSTGNHIQGNFIGTDRSGTFEQNITSLTGVGIGGGASGNVVGGTTPAAHNIISDNGDNNVFVSGNNNRIQGNYINTDKNGTNGVGQGAIGITLRSASGTMVGGTTAASRNVISGIQPQGSGTGLIIEDSQGTKVLGNRIGTTADGTSPLGNGLHGISIVGDSNDNLIGDGTADGSNTIAFNGGDGINIAEDTATGNRISRNSIFSNTGLGIDLAGGFQDATGANANDSGDPDAGPNHLQNRPSLGSARTASGKTTINGTLSSRPGTSYTVQFFSNPSGTNEGRVYIGQRSVFTDGTGKVSFTVTSSSKVSAGRTITATAIRNSNGDTSEFSAPKTVTS